MKLALIALEHLLIVFNVQIKSPTSSMAHANFAPTITMKAMDPVCNVPMVVHQHVLLNGSASFVPDKCMT